MTFRTLYSLLGYKWVITISSGIFMFFALTVYKVYNIDDYPALSGHSTVFRAFSHALSISIIFYLMEFRLSKHLSVNDKIKPLITATIAIAVGIQVSFMLFNYYYKWTELSWKSYSMFLYEYPLLLIIPIGFSYLLDRVVKPPLFSTYDIIDFVSKNGKESTKIKETNLLYIKSDNNYVEIHYKSGTAQATKLIRQNLQTIDQKLREFPHILRCHRSYIVNLDQVDQIKTNNNKVELTLAGKHIPVSNKYRKAILNMVS